MGMDSGKWAFILLVLQVFRVLAAQLTIEVFPSEKDIFE
jgi:hypothetical protein